MSGTAIIIIIIAVILVIWLLGQSIRTVRPTSRGLVERFGKYNRFANPVLYFSFRSSNVWFGSTSRKI